VEGIQLQLESKEDLIAIVRALAKVQMLNGIMDQKLLDLTARISMQAIEILEPKE
jgi:hypothetical protein